MSDIDTSEHHLQPHQKKTKSKGAACLQRRVKRRYNIEHSTFYLELLQEAGETELRHTSYAFPQPTAGSSSAFPSGPLAIELIFAFTDDCASHLLSGFWLLRMP